MSQLHSFYQRLHHQSEINPRERTPRIRYTKSFYKIESASIPTKFHRNRFSGLIVKTKPTDTATFVFTILVSSHKNIKRLQIGVLNCLSTLYLDFQHNIDSRNYLFIRLIYSSYFPWQILIEQHGFFLSRYFRHHPTTRHIPLSACQVRPYSDFRQVSAVP